MKTPTQAADFDEATRVVPQAQEGRFLSQVHPGWDGPLAPNGGHLAAMLLRAARAHLNRKDLTPRTLSVHFPRPATHGTATITVEAIRVGIGSALLRSEMRQDDRVCCTALLTCVSTRTATLPIQTEAPEAPRWQDTQEFDFGALEGTPALFSRMRIRPCFGPPPLSGAGDALTGGWMELRDDSAPIDFERQVALSDMWWPAVFGATKEFVGAPTLELTCHFRSSVAPTGPVLGRFRTRTVAEGFLDETAELWTQDGTLLAEAKQMALLISPSA